MSVQEDKVLNSAKKKLQKFQSNKKNNQNSLEQEIINLKERLFKAEERNEILEHEIKLLRKTNTELQNILIDNVDEIRFTDNQALESYEREERAIFNEFKSKLHELKTKHKADSTELCRSCMGELIEI